MGYGKTIKLKVKVGIYTPPGRRTEAKYGTVYEREKVGLTWGVRHLINNMKIKLIFLQYMECMNNIDTST
jgi:hypothetical protein